MRQKTQLACALIRPAALLVLDEPVVGLDPPSQVLLRELLVAAKRDGVAVLMTTHQLRFADGVADRGVVLEEGRVADEGPWPELYARSVARGVAVVLSASAVSAASGAGRRTSLGDPAVARGGPSLAFAPASGFRRSTRPCWCSRSVARSCTARPARRSRRS